MGQFASDDVDLPSAERIPLCRWMNNLLMRELPLGATIRLWDTYLSEGSGRAFADFHVYVCAAFLRLWSSQLQHQKDFQVGKSLDPVLEHPGRS